MGEIAEMMLDGTMDPETGEWNFDGADGPGWPMTAREAEEYKRAFPEPGRRRRRVRVKHVRMLVQPKSAKKLARLERAAQSPMGKHRRKWLERCAVEEQEASQAPGVFKALSGMGFVDLVTVGTAVKGRITDKGRAKLLEKP